MSPGRYGQRGRADECLAVADLTLDGQVIGTVAELHPRVIAAFGLPERSAAALVNLSVGLRASLLPQTITPVMTFPAIAYDVTVKADAHVTVGPMLARLKAADPLVERAEVADLYVGSEHKDGAYNLTLRLTYRAPDRTLAEGDVQPLHQRLVKDVIALPVV
jgi:phenylalanyl-tRNA synthetase beta chain